MALPAIENGLVVFCGTCMGTKMYTSRRTACAKRISLSRQKRKSCIYIYMCVCVCACVCIISKRNIKYYYSTEMIDFCNPIWYAIFMCTNSYSQIKRIKYAYIFSLHLSSQHFVQTLWGHSSM